jgi:hypothetical protein
LREKSFGIFQFGRMNKSRPLLLIAALIASAGFARGGDAVITVDAGKILHRVSPYLTGACIEDVNHEIYGGLYSQMIFGESFQEPAPQEVQPGAVNGWAGGVSGMWRGVQRGDARGQCSIETNGPFVGVQSQRITFAGGTGEIGVANQGLNRWGIPFVAGRSYEGCLDARCDAPSDVSVALESADGSKVYARRDISVTSNNWQHLDFTVTSPASDNNGRFTIMLRKPGSVVIGYAFLQPGAWGRFQGLPARLDVANGLIDQGITVLRYGGSMVNAAGYRWKHMIGPRDRRPPYKGTWYPYSTDGWGIFDFLNFCQAAGFLGVPDLNVNETPQDMADFIEYANGQATTVWGARRAADGHPDSYRLKYIELGNEERVDGSYYEKFRPVAEAIWAKDTNVILVVGDFAYSHPLTDPFHFAGADSGITTMAAHQQILRLARQHDREVWFDVHVWTAGPESHFDQAIHYNDALEGIAEGAKFRVVVFELNADNHSQRRAIANALAINAAKLDGRFPIVTSANCLQPDGQNDNGWDQGLLFLNPAQVWLQPPGYVTRMMARHYDPLAVQSQCAGGGAALEACATRSDDGTELVLCVVNSGRTACPATIKLSGFSPGREFAVVEELAGSLDAKNMAGNPEEIQPARKQWRHAFQNGEGRFEFQARSITVIQFQ